MSEKAHQETDKPKNFLEEIRNAWPIKSAHWSKKETLALREAVLLYYEIEPCEDNPYYALLYRFQDFVQYGDIHHLWELMESSIVNRSLVIMPNNLIETQKFCRWLVQKDFLLPPVFITAMEIMNAETGDNKSPIALRQLKDMQKIDFNQLPLPVLKSLGANAIAQARKRVAQDSTIKQSEILNSPCMKQFKEICSKLEGGDISDDTLREYIENQFSGS